MKTVSRRVVAALCVLLRLAGVAPMYAIAFYNHPYYDDFGFTIEPHAVWRDTGDVGATLRAGWERAKLERSTWQGTYTSTVLSAVQPGVFSETYYYWTTLLLLTSLLLGVGFAVWAFCREMLNADRASALSVASLTLFVVTQFLPDVSEAVYWFNGGFGYTFGAMTLYLGLGAAIKLQYARRPAAVIGWTALTALLLLLAGGDGYPCALLTVCVFAFIALCAFLTRSRRKWIFLALWVWLAACFLYNCTAPGNLARAATLGAAGKSVPRTVAEAFYFGFALMGDFFSLPMLAVCVAAAALLLPALKRCKLAFSHPVWMTLACAALFCAQLAPTLYTGNYLGDGRVRDVYWYAYVAMGLLLTLYWAGWWAKRGPDAPAEAPRARLAPLLVAAVLLVFGCIGWKPDGAESYGPQNMAGGSALRSLTSGQAARYDAAMDARDALLNDRAQTEVTLTPITDVPAVFMSGALAGDMLEYVKSLYAEYYDKAAVTVAGEE